MRFLVCDVDGYREDDWLDMTVVGMIRTQRHVLSMSRSLIKRVFVRRLNLFKLQFRKWVTSIFSEKGRNSHTLSPNYIMLVGRGFDSQYHLLNVLYKPFFFLPLFVNCHLYWFYAPSLYVLQQVNSDYYVRILFPYIFSSYLNCSLLICLQLVSYFLYFRYSLSNKVSFSFSIL